VSSPHSQAQKPPPLEWPVSVAPATDDSGSSFSISAGVYRRITEVGMPTPSRSRSAAAAALSVLKSATICSVNMLPSLQTSLPGNLKAQIGRRLLHYSEVIGVHFCTFRTLAVLFEPTTRRITLCRGLPVGRPAASPGTGSRRAPPSWFSWAQPGISAMSGGWHLPRHSAGRSERDDQLQLESARSAIMTNVWNGYHGDNNERTLPLGHRRRRWPDGLCCHRAMFSLPAVTDWANDGVITHRLSTASGGANSPPGCDLGREYPA
jgi:hypothetical protein